MKSEVLELKSEREQREQREKQEGIEMVVKLYQILKKLGRDADADKAMYDMEVMDRLLKEFEKEIEEALHKPPLH